MTDSFAGFPLPAVLGLDIGVTEVAKMPGTQAWALFANLSEAPQTKVTNVVFTDQSTLYDPWDSRGSGCWNNGWIAESCWTRDESVGYSREFRRRSQKTWSSKKINVKTQASLSCDGSSTQNCPTHSSSSTQDTGVAGTAAYWMTYNVAPEPGKNWRMELSHNVLGAYTRLEEGSGHARMGFQNGSWTNLPIVGRVRLNGGTWQNFNITPSPNSLSRGTSSLSTQFSGSNALVLTGSASTNVEIEYSLPMRTRSDGPWYGNGAEGSIRKGLSSTLHHDFRAGRYMDATYPRNSKLDGHFMAVKACTNTGVACP